MPLNYAESVRHKLRALTGKNPGHEIGTGFAALAEDVDKYLLGLVSHSSEVTTTSGEVALMTATATVKLPAATLDTITGAVCTEGVTTIKAEGGPRIFGDFLAEAGVTEIKLTKGQHVILLADGTNYRIVAGEPKREQEYSGFIAKTLAEAHAGFVPSTTRPAQVQIKLRSAETTWGAHVEVNGKQAGWLLQGAGAGTISVFVPPGQTVKIDKDEPFGEKLAAGVTLEVSTLLG